MICPVLFWAAEDADGDGLLSAVGLESSWVFLLWTSPQAVELGSSSSSSVSMTTEIVRRYSQSSDVGFLLLLIRGRLEACHLGHFDLEGSQYQRMFQH